LFSEYPFSSNYLETDNGKLHYVDEGGGPVVVMVHGNPTWSYYYRNLISAVKKNHRVIALDHLGCGLSDKPQDYQYTLENHIANLELLLATLDIDKFSLVVHDWGGAIGMGVATGRPEAIKKIVVLNTAAFRSKLIPFRIRLCRLPVFGEFLVRFFNGFAWPATFMAVTTKMDPEVAKAYIAPYDTWKNRIATYRFVQDIPLEPDHVSYDTLVQIEQELTQLNELGVPMQIVWGGKDFCFNDVFFNEWIQRFPQAESHYYKDGGHYILEDKRRQAIPLIQSFLNK